MLAPSLRTADPDRPLVTLCDSRSVDHVIDSTLALAAVPEGTRPVLDDDLFGKVVIAPA